eukprot:COSAG02_NODE_4538_length_5235_cov_13.865204_2_plen_1325_part_00
MTSAAAARTARAAAGAHRAARDRALRRRPAERHRLYIYPATRACSPSVNLFKFPTQEEKERFGDRYHRMRLHRVATTLPRRRILLACVLFEAGSLLQPAAGFSAGPARKYEIPTMPWPTPLPPDWVSVTTVGGAKADGRTDDTNAIQATVDLYTTCKDKKMNASTAGVPLGAHTCGGEEHGATPCSTIFFPAGTYRISKPIYVGHCEGLIFMGTGATTVIEWGGAAEGTMFISNGTVFGRWEGIVWDGRHSAKWGVSYNSTHGSLFETREMHRNCRFSNFLDAGISVGVTNDGIRSMGKKETAEALVQNCIFENSYKGVALQDFNDYDWAIDGCTFMNNSYGVYSHTHMDSNWDVHSCRFEGSLIADLTAAAEASNVRQVVSVGSYQFLATLGGGGYHSPLQIHDCRVANWTGPSAISFDLRGPLTVSNNEFFSANATQTLVSMHQGGSYSAVLLEGGNLRNMMPVNVNSTGFLDATSGPRVHLESIAGATLTSTTELTVDTNFHRSEWPTPSRVLVCTDAPYSVNSSEPCVQQQAAIQACFSAASKQGAGTMAYLPGGSYEICKPLEITSGSDFFVRGAGYATTITFGHPAPPPAPPAPHPGPHPPPGPPAPRHADKCKKLPPKTSEAFKVMTNGTCTSHGYFDINSRELCAKGVAAVGFSGRVEGPESFIDGCYMSSSCTSFFWCPPDSGHCQKPGPTDGYCAVICATEKPPPAPSPPPGPHPHPPPPPPPGPHPATRCDPTVKPPEKCPGDKPCPHCGTNSCVCPAGPPSPPPSPSPHPPPPPRPPPKQQHCHRPPNCRRGMPNHCPADLHMIFDEDGSGDKGCAEYSTPTLKLEPITDVAECKTGLAAMGYTATLNSSITGPKHPPGCVIRAWPEINQYYFNTAHGQSKHIIGPHGSDCAVLCKASNMNLTLKIDQGLRHNSTNGASQNGAKSITARASPNATPSLNELPAHIVVTGNVQKFRLEGFMFKSERNYNRTTKVTAIDQSCAVRVDPGTHTSSSQQWMGVADDERVSLGPMDFYADWLFYDSAYNGSACGIQVLGLGTADVARFGYIDMSLDVADSAQATVLVDFMTGGRLQVRGNEGKQRTGFMGIKMFAGLAIDYDIVITDSQDLAIGYLYAESLSHHVKLQGSSPSGPPGIPGNIAIRGVKIHAYQLMKKGGDNTSIWLEAEGWAGSLLYTNSQAEYCDGCQKLNSEAPASAQAKACKCYEVKQTGTAAFNLSLIGNSWWAIGSGAKSDDYAQPNGNGPVFTGMNADKNVVMLGGIVDNWGSPSNPWFAGNVSVPDLSGPSKRDQDWRVSTGMDLFTKLGLIDLAVNYGA